MSKVVVPYGHIPEDLAIIELAVVRRGVPAESDWKPAYRDTVDGERVVWARFDNMNGAVWVRDDEGARRVSGRKE